MESVRSMDPSLVPTSDLTRKTVAAIKHFVGRTPVEHVAEDGSVTLEWTGTAAHITMVIEGDTGDFDVRHFDES